jgi:serine/threonine protein kinase
MTLASGAKLGPYEIVSPLGAGGMGEVYRARDTRLDRTVAIKVLPSHLSADPGLKLRFEREAKAISALQHPNICTLYDVGSQDGVDFLVMECLEGQTLADRLVKGALPLEQVLKIGAEIAEALEKAHRQGIVHRDLKPGNIMLTKSGAKLMDFGLAKPELTVATGTKGLLTPSTPTMNLASLTSAASPLTQKGSIVGTFQYLAPEVLQGSEADARSDLFSLGCVLYEMVTGRRAFEGKSQLGVLTAILEKEPEPIATIPAAPPMLDRVVRACLAKDPADRYQAAHDVAMDLRWMADSARR